MFNCYQPFYLRRYEESNFITAEYYLPSGSSFEVSIFQQKAIWHITYNLWGASISSIILSYWKQHFGNCNFYICKLWLFFSSLAFIVLIIYELCFFPMLLESAFPPFLYAILLFLECMSRPSSEKVRAREKASAEQWL